MDDVGPKPRWFFGASHVWILHSFTMARWQFFPAPPTMSKMWSSPSFPSAGFHAVAAPIWSLLPGIWWIEANHRRNKIILHHTISLWISTFHVMVWNPPANNCISKPTFFATQFYFQAGTWPQWQVFLIPTCGVSAMVLSCVSINNPNFNPKFRTWGCSSSYKIL